MKVLIIGGVAGGINTATRLRRLDESAQIILLEKNACISYAHCGIPYYIGKLIQDEKQLLLTNIDYLQKTYGIEVRSYNEVIEIDRLNKEIKIYDHLNKSEYVETYDKLVIATGAKPKRIEVEGMNSPGIFTLYNVNDVIQIDEYINQKNVKKITIIGGDYKGLELIENLKLRGFDLSLVEESRQVCENLDIEMANLVHAELKSNEICLYLNAKTLKVETQQNQLSIHLSDGCIVNSEMIVYTPSFVPESSLARSAELELGVNGSIRVNEYYQTSDYDIYAIGDVIEVHHLVSDCKDVIAAASSAIRQGRLVASNLVKLRNKESFKVLNTSIFKLFSLSIASVGMNERQLTMHKIKYLKVFAFP